MQYNIKNIGGEVLNLDGPLDHESAKKLADEIEAEHDIAVVLVEVAMPFTFSTDSETGTIEAVTFSEACQKLDEMVSESAIADGAWGWVDDIDGTRYQIGQQ